MHSLSKYRLGNREELEAFLAHTERRFRGVSTGISGIDSFFCGMQGIVGLVGDTEACKSTFALQVALQNAKTEIPVLFIDRENSRPVMYERIMSHLMGMGWEAFRKTSRERRSDCYLRMQKLPFILYTEGFSKEELRIYVDELVSSSSERALLVLDSLHKLPNDYDNMRSSIDHWLIFLEQLKAAYGTKLTILLTCEKNRTNYGQAETSAPKESGRIEYTLDQQFDMSRDKESSDILFKCTKNRHGHRGEIIRLRKVFAPDSGFTFTLEEVGFEETI